MSYLPYLRHPKTTNEKRQNATVEHKDMVRAKRRPMNLADEWDDAFVKEDKESEKARRRSLRKFRRSIKHLMVDE